LVRWTVIVCRRKLLDSAPRTIFSGTHFVYRGLYQLTKNAACGDVIADNHGNAGDLSDIQSEERVFSWQS
jgi:hypothetical protein